MHRFNPENRDPYERKRRLRAAGQEGFAPAMYDYGLACDDPGQRKHWLVMAAQEGNVCAVYLLGQNPG
jgi:hypothetical protein